MFRRLLTTVRYPPNFEEKQYLGLISNILDKGEFQQGRNGNVYSSIGKSMRFSLKNNTMPLLTTKKVAWKTCLKELLWFVNTRPCSYFSQFQTSSIPNFLNSKLPQFQTSSIQNFSISHLVHCLYGKIWGFGVFL